MSADVNGSASRTQAGWFAFGLAALIVCGIAGVFLDYRLETLVLPHRWGPNATSALDRAPREVREEAMYQLDVSKFRGGAIALGLLAGSLAIAFYLADAVKLRSSNGLGFALVGVIVAAAAGAAGGYGAMKLQEKLEKASLVELTTTEAMMIQAAAWSCAGLGVAFSVWISSRGRRSAVDTLLGGIFAGALVGALYPTAVSLAFPSDNTNRFFPDRGLFPSQLASGASWAFLFWAMFPCVVYAIVLGGVSRQVEPAKLEAEPAPERVAT